MVMRVATMSPISSVEPSASLQEPSYLFRKLVLLLLLMTAAVLWIALLFRNQTNFPPLLQTFFADASLGLIAGFGSRVVLRKPGIRMAAGIVMTILAMILIGRFSDNVLGIGPINLESKAAEQISQLKLDSTLPDQIGSLNIDLLKLFDFHEMEWADLIHLAISLLMSVMSLLAWQGTPSPMAQVVEVAPLPTPQVAPRSTRVGAGSLSSHSNGQAHVQLPGEYWVASPRPSPRTSRRTRSNNGSRSPVLREAKKGKSQLTRPKRKRSRSKAQIQFALVEEHRCPYCLDMVTRNDSRGVKECEVCHTLHHADCWAITGMCQVPHLNT